MRYSAAVLVYHGRYRAASPSPMPPSAVRRSSHSRSRAILCACGTASRCRLCSKLPSAGQDPLMRFAALWPLERCRNATGCIGHAGREDHHGARTTTFGTPRSSVPCLTSRSSPPLLPARPRPRPSRTPLAPRPHLSLWIARIMHPMAAPPRMPVKTRSSTPASPACSAAAGDVMAASTPLPKAQGSQLRRRWLRWCGLGAEAPARTTQRRMPEAGSWQSQVSCKGAAPVATCGLSCSGCRLMRGWLGVTGSPGRV